ncbi:hypothetical protein ACH4S8_24770 [Streptomyces sp. NPDC021080]
MPEALTAAAFLGGAWGSLLQNQRGAVVAHAVRRETDTVIRRLRFRLS